MPESIYQDIAERTGGDIYIGIVGPVRSGKSTFIKRFMETLVLPNMSDAFEKERAKDEMPQSAAGKTVMTTEPKFIPDEAVEIVVDKDARMRVKMVDCVGYLIPGAMGQIENGAQRMVMTPWSADPMPFKEAAELGTRKVIADHSTIGLVVTTDGSIGEFPREAYEEAEGRVVAELTALGKPFCIILNSEHPQSDASAALAATMEEKYHAPVALVNCLTLDAEDINGILSQLLLEFPVKEINLTMPSWTMALDSDNWLRTSLTQNILHAAQQIMRVGEIRAAFSNLEKDDNIDEVVVQDINLGNGCARIAITLKEPLYYQMLSELTGLSIPDEAALIGTMKELAKIKHEYDKVAPALEEVNRTGYGIVMPDVEELQLGEPEVVRQAGGYGVRLHAGAPSIHMIRADIETEINPIIGSEAQSEELIRYLRKESENDPSRIWESNIFGKTMHELVNDGMQAKLDHMSEEARKKLSEALERVINEGSGGLICIIL